MARVRVASVLVLALLALGSAQQEDAPGKEPPETEVHPKGEHDGYAFVTPGHPLDADVLTALDALEAAGLVALDPNFDDLAEGLPLDPVPGRDDALQTLAVAAGRGHPMAMAALGEMWLFLSPAVWPPASRIAVDATLRRESEAFAAGGDDPLLPTALLEHVSEHGTTDEGRELAAAALRERAGGSDGSGAAARAAALSVGLRSDDDAVLLLAGAARVGGITVASLSAQIEAVTGALKPGQGLHIGLKPPPGKPGLPGTKTVTNAGSSWALPPSQAVQAAAGERAAELLLALGDSGIEVPVLAGGSARDAAALEAALATAGRPMAQLMRARRSSEHLRRSSREGRLNDGGDDDHHSCAWAMHDLTALAEATLRSGDVTASMVAPGTAFWELFENAEAAADSAERASSRKLYQTLADAGDAGAADELGNMFFHGDAGAGVEQDMGEALRHFRRAAELGHPRGHANMGMMHLNGLGWGVQQGGVEGGGEAAGPEAGWAEAGAGRAEVGVAGDVVGGAGVAAGAAGAAGLAGLAGAGAAAGGAGVGRHGPAGGADGAGGLDAGGGVGGGGDLGGGGGDLGGGGLEGGGGLGGGGGGLGGLDGGLGRAAAWLAGAWAHALRWGADAVGRAEEFEPAGRARWRLEDAAAGYGATEGRQAEDAPETRRLAAEGPSDAAALWHYERAAAMGEVSAISGLGYMYMQGRGVDVNKTRAVELLEEASLAGDTQASTNLAVILLDGEEEGEAGEEEAGEEEDGEGRDWNDVPRNASRARLHLELAAGAGVTEGMFNLALMESQGWDGAPNCSEGLPWMRAVAERGVWRRHTLVSREEADVAWTPPADAGQSRDVGRAARHLAVLSSLGLAHAQADLGFVLERGLGAGAMGPSPAEGEAGVLDWAAASAKDRSWLTVEAAIRDGDPRGAVARSVAAKAARAGRRTTLGGDDWAGWALSFAMERPLAEAAEAGDAFALRRIGMCRLPGGRCPTDVGDAVAWLRRAANVSDGHSLHALALLAMRGQGPDAGPGQWDRAARLLRECEQADYLGGFAVLSARAELAGRLASKALAPGGEANTTASAVLRDALRVGLRPPPATAPAGEEEEDYEAQAAREREPSVPLGPLWLSPGEARAVSATLRGIAAALALVTSAAAAWAVLVTGVRPVPAL